LEDGKKKTISQRARKREIWRKRRACNLINKREKTD